MLSLSNASRRTVLMDQGEETQLGILSDEATGNTGKSENER